MKFYSSGFKLFSKIILGFLFLILIFSIISFIFKVDDDVISFIVILCFFLLFIYVIYYNMIIYIVEDDILTIKRFFSVIGEYNLKEVKVTDSYISRNSEIDDYEYFDLIDFLFGWFLVIFTNRGMVYFTYNNESEKLNLSSLSKIDMYKLVEVMSDASVK